MTFLFWLLSKSKRKKIPLIFCWVSKLILCMMVHAMALQALHKHQLYNPLPYMGHRGNREDFKRYSLEKNYFCPNSADPQLLQCKEVNVGL